MEERTWRRGQKGYEWVDLKGFKMACISIVREYSMSENPEIKQYFSDNEYAIKEAIDSFHDASTENDIHDIVENALNSILKEDYVKYNKYNNPYDDNKKGNGVTQPLKNGVDLHDVRGRISNILYALKNERTDDAKKQLLRLYKLVDAMINQGF